MSRVTWVTPYYDAYASAYRETPSEVTVGRMVRTIKQLETDHGPEETVRRFTRYVSVTPARYFSIHHFAETFPGWSVPVTAARVPGGVPDPQPGESTDAYISRLANLGF